jgi:hypothetical protein
MDGAIQEREIGRQHGGEQHRIKALELEAIPLSSRKHERRVVFREISIGENLARSGGRREKEKRQRQHEGAKVLDSLRASQLSSLSATRDVSPPQVEEREDGLWREGGEGVGDDRGELLVGRDAEETLDGAAVAIARGRRVRTMVGQRVTTCIPERSTLRAPLKQSDMSSRQQQGMTMRMSKQRQRKRAKLSRTRLRLYLWRSYEL